MGVCVCASWCDSWCHKCILGWVVAARSGSLPSPPPAPPSALSLLLVRLTWNFRHIFSSSFVAFCLATATLRLTSVPGGICCHIPCLISRRCRPAPVPVPIIHRTCVAVSPQTAALYKHTHTHTHLVYVLDVYIIYIFWAAQRSVA